MPRIITAKIDVTKIEKKRLFEGRNGAKYLDLVIIENRDGTDQYGNDFMVCQSVSKEERERNIKGPILGNARFVVKQQPAQPPQSQHGARLNNPPPGGKPPEEEGDIPF